MRANGDEMASSRASHIPRHLKPIDELISEGRCQEVGALQTRRLQTVRESELPCVNWRIAQRLEPEIAESTLIKLVSVFMWPRVWTAMRT